MSEVEEEELSPQSSAEDEVEEESTGIATGRDRRRAARMATRAAVVLLATLVLALATAVVLAKSSWGEDRARLAVQDAVGKAMDGHLVMDRLGDFEVFSPIGVLRGTAENIRVHASDGTEVFGVGELSAELDLSALLSREIYVRNLTISGAQVPFDLERGRPNLPMPPAQRKAFEPRFMDLRLNDVEVVGLYFVAKKEDGERAIVGRLSGRLDVTVPGDMPGVTMNVRGLKGVLSHPEAIRLHDASGVIDTRAQMVADLRFSADSSGSGVTGRLKYFPRDPNDPLRISIENVRAIDARMMGNPLDALGGAGLPMELLQGMAPSNLTRPGGRPR